jgi:hypothetical protein
MDGKKTKFKVIGGDPVILEITREDGSVYLAKVAVAVFDVVDTGLLDAGNMPVFNVRATLAVDAARPAS